MGLYDNRLSELSDPRRSRRVAQRSAPRLGPRPFSPPLNEAARKPMRAQSLLFGRNAGWTAVKAKAWAKSHGYRHGKVDVTDQYVRIRQFDPKGLKVKRTITLGQGIRAVVAREENSMAAKKKSSRHRTRKSTTAAKPATRRRAKRRVTREAPRRTRRALPGGTMMEAKRRTKKRRSPKKRRSVARESWFGDTPGHRKAAKKGHKRRKSSRRRTTRESTVYEARKPRRRARRVREVSESPKRRRRSSKRRGHSYSTHEAKRRRSSKRRRSHSMFASRRSSGGSGMSGMQFAVAALSGGLGFVLADALDRFLATYNPDPTKAGDKPKDKFTSDGAGTLANTLNLAATPHLVRIGAGVGMTALPAVASMFVKNPLARSSLEGMAIGSGIKLFSLFWNNIVMGSLLAPKDTSVAGLQKSVIARLYPAEIAATINTKQAPPQLNAAAAVASGSLSGTGVGDVGPFALQGSSEYPDAAQALRNNAGVHGQFPSMQNVWGTGGPSEYPTATQVLRQRTGVSADPVPSPVPQGYQPGPPDGPGPGPQATPHKDEGCGCIGEDNAFLGFVGDAGEDTLYNSATKAA